MVELAVAEDSEGAKAPIRAFRPELFVALGDEAKEWRLASNRVASSRRSAAQVADASRQLVKLIKARAVVGCLKE